MKKHFLLLTCFCITMTMQAEIHQTVHISAGELIDSLRRFDETSITNLTVTGSINALDVQYMRNRMTSLAVIDLSETTIQAYTNSYGYLYPANEMPENSFYFEESYQADTILKSIILPNTITSIGIHAFYKCTGLTGITIPNSVIAIKEGAFTACENMSDITIPNSVTSIGTCAFLSCIRLTDVRIGNSVSTIGSYAFDQCWRLTSVTIPNSVTAIGEGAFYYCTGITQMHIGHSVSEIGRQAFKGMMGEMTVDPNNSNFSCRDSILFNKDQTKLWWVNEKKTGSYVIPSSVTSIESDAFSDCTKLTGITIPNSVVSFGIGAFQNCAGLTNLSIPNSITSIGESVFYNCSGLTSLDIGKNVTSIGKYAFGSCTELRTIQISNSVTSIDEAAFSSCYKATRLIFGKHVASIGDDAFSGCMRLDSIYTYSKSPAVLGSNVFETINKAGCILCVPTKSKTTYQSTSGWNEFEHIVEGELPDNKYNIVLYPNPVSEGFRINGLIGPSTLTITDESGKMMLSRKVQVNEFIPASFLHEGFYFVKITTLDETFKTKLIKL